MNEILENSLKELESELNDLKKIKDFYSVLENTGKELVSTMNDLNQRNDSFVQNNQELIEDTVLVQADGVPLRLRPPVSGRCCRRQSDVFSIPVIADVSV